VTEFELDPEDLKRLKAQAEQHLANEQQTHRNDGQESADMSGAPLPNERKEGNEPTSRVDNLPSGKSFNYGAPRRWAELVYSPSNRVGIHFGSYVLSFVGVILPLVVVNLLYGEMANLRASDRIQEYAAAAYWIKLPLVVASIVIAIFLLTYSKRLRAPNALTVMEHETRAPILLLRAFQDDNAPVQNSAPLGDWRQIASRFGVDRSISFEEMLYDLFSNCGPVIAIGRPNEQLPPLGSARFWVRNDRTDRWKEVVEMLLFEAKRTILIMGHLPGRKGLTWEAEKVLSLSTPEKAVLVMPPINEEEAKNRWESYRELPNVQLPPFQGGELAAGFSPDRGCQVVRLANKKRERDEAAYREAFRVPARSRFRAVLVVSLLIVVWGFGPVSMLLPAIQLLREKPKRACAAEMLRSIALDTDKDSAKLQEFGIYVAPVTDEQAIWHGLHEGNGLIACYVAEDSPAAKAGLQSHDVLIALDGQPIPKDRNEFTRMLDKQSQNRPAGHVPQFTYARGMWPHNWRIWLALAAVPLCAFAFAVCVFRRYRRNQVVGVLDFR
jgi:hypothetical protein